LGIDVKEVPPRLRKFLIVLALVVCLVMTFALYASGPPILAVIPLAVATVAHPVIKYVAKLKAPTPSLLCRGMGSLVTLLINTAAEAWRDVIRIPFIVWFRTLLYVVAGGLLTTQLLL
jgi:hypothetical protein